MPFVFSMKDTYRQSVEAASGGKKTVLYDDKGIPSIMNIIPRMSYADLGLGASTDPFPAFVRNSVILPEIFIGTYLASIHDSRAYSLPGMDPAASINFDTALARCRDKGPGWHMVTQAEYAFLAYWCEKNGYHPRGNNQYGADISAPHEKGRVTYTYNDGGTIRNGRTGTGTGPASWNHDGTTDGIADLNGNVWEWAAGVRTLGGEIQILPDNDAALSTANLTAASPQWRAMLQSGALVAPATADTLKYDATGANGTGTAKVNKVITSQSDGSGNTDNTFQSIAVESGITIPDRLKALALFPWDNSKPYGADRFYTRNEGERLFFRGGDWGHGSHAGVFDSHGNDPRSNVSSLLGFRVAFAPEI